MELNTKLQKAMVADWDEELDETLLLTGSATRRASWPGAAPNPARKATKLKGINCSMNFDDFYHSMFELADHWTDTVDQITTWFFQKCWTR